MILLFFKVFEPEPFRGFDEQDDRHHWLMMQAPFGGATYVEQACPCLSVMAHVPGLEFTKVPKIRSARPKEPGR
ncbi:hypothetical protein ATO1_25970 [Phaeobacter sp. 22II1-1F12B]|nr:hypothetical protein ATO1_25970 [Phaeobacter sp. 22II1-1F12B]